MNRLIIGVLAATVALLGAASASAITANMTTSYAGQPLNVGDTVTVEVFLDADQTLIQLLSVGVLFDEGELTFVPETSAEQGVPTYILYGSSGMQMTSLEMQQDPWQLWPGTVPPGQDQMNINWADPSFTGTFVTGLGIKIAQVTFQVASLGDGSASIELSSTAGGNVLQVGGVVVPFPVTGTPIAVTLPEPSSAGLALSALGTVYGVYALRKRARRV